jgi:hypothetical protein
MLLFGECGKQSGHVDNASGTRQPYKKKKKKKREQIFFVYPQTKILS